MFYPAAGQVLYSRSSCNLQHCRHNAHGWQLVLAANPHSTDHCSPPRAPHAHPCFSCAPCCLWQQFIHEFLLFTPPRAPFLDLTSTSSRTGLTTPAETGHQNSTSIQQSSSSSSNGTHTWLSVVAKHVSHDKLTRMVHSPAQRAQRMQPATCSASWGRGRCFAKVCGSTVMQFAVMAAHPPHLCFCSCCCS